MKKKKKELKSLKRSLNRSPKIPGVNGLLNFKFLEKREGQKDAQEHQVCESAAGHITPYITVKTRLYDSYIEKMYLKTSLHMEEMVKEAHALIIEFFLINKKMVNVNDNVENMQRHAAMQAKKEDRKSEILIRITEIKAASNMIDECLCHHIERAEAIFHSRISGYWKGILSVLGDEKLNYFPVLEKREYDARKMYQENREKLVTMIENTINEGGVSYEKE